MLRSGGEELSFARRIDFVLARRTLFFVGLQLVGGAGGGVGRLFELAAGGGGALAMFGQLRGEFGCLGRRRGELRFLAAAVDIEPDVWSVC